VHALVVAVCSLHALVPFLCFYAQRGDRAGFETLDTDRFIRFLAIAVSAVVYPVERRIDLRNQPPFTRACPQLDGPLGLK
jgi:hypothetical protein